MGDILGLRGKRLLVNEYYANGFGVYPMDNKLNDGLNGFNTPMDRGEIHELMKDFFHSLIVLYQGILLRHVTVEGLCFSTKPGEQTCEHTHSALDEYQTCGTWN